MSTRVAARRSRRISTVARLFDLRLPSNRYLAAAFAAVLLGGLAVSVVQGDGAGEAFGKGLQAALAVFLSWAIARELDPDRPAAATVAAPVGALILLTGDPRLWPVTALLFAVRIVARTTGASPNVLDLVWLPAIAALSAASEGGLVAALALAAALAWDTTLVRRASRPAVMLASAIVAAGAAVAVAAAVGTLDPAVAMPAAAQSVVLVAALLAVPALLRSPCVPGSVGDLDGAPLCAARLLRARLLAVVAGALTVAWMGGAAAPALVALWAALIGVAVGPTLLGVGRRQAVDAGERAA